MLSESLLQMTVSRKVHPNHLIQFLHFKQNKNELIGVTEREDSNHCQLFCKTRNLRRVKKYFAE